MKYRKILPSISVIMPVHNEEKLLPYSLRSLVDAPIDEFCVLFDRCTDKSKQIVESWQRRYKPQFQVRTEENWEVSWKSPIAEVVTKAFDMASCDVVYGLAADIVFDPYYFNPRLFFLFDIVYFGYFNWDMTKNTLANAYRKTLENIRLLFEEPATPYRMGIFAVKWPVWDRLRFRDVVHTRSSPVEDYEQDFILRLKKDGYNSLFLPNTVVHLRTRSFLASQKALIRQQLNYPLYRVVLHSYLHLRPQVLTEFLRLPK